MHGRGTSIVSRKTHRWTFAGVAVGALLVLCAPASAWRLQVVDEDGRPQVAVASSETDGNVKRWSDGRGVIDLPPTAGLWNVTRSPAGRPGCGAPEGNQGVGIRWEPGAPEEQRVVLPTVLQPSYDPGHNTAEQRFMAIWNEHRVARDLPRATPNRPLALAADWYSAFLEGGLLTPCKGSDPATRAHASLFAGADVRESRTIASSADAAFRNLLGGEESRQVLEDPKLVVAGVGVNQGTWVLKAATECRDTCAPPDLSTADTLGPDGEPGGDDDDGPGGGDPLSQAAADSPFALLPGQRGAAGVRPRLRVSVTRRARRRFVVRVRTTNAARGALYVRVRRGGYSRRLRATRARGVWSARLTLPRRGSYALDVLLDGRDGFADLRLRPRTLRAR
jgi:hypothetical protein